MEKERHLAEIFVTIFFLAVLVLGYFFAKTTIPLSPVPSSVESISAQKQNILFDAQSGEPLSKEFVAQVSQKQANLRVTYTLSGRVTVKLRDSLQVEIEKDGQTRLLQLSFSPKMVFLKETPLLGYEKDSSATEEKKISLADVKVGDNITVVFPKGITPDSLNKKTGMIEISNLIVNIPQQEVAGKD